MQVFIVRQEGNEEHLCGVYSSMELALANKHRHQRNDDEIISWVLDDPPLLYDGKTGLRVVDNRGM